ncbi:MAG: RHS repeat-associated core domain-containing protein [Acidobacteriota bacterium]
MPICLQDANRLAFWPRTLKKLEDLLFGGRFGGRLIREGDTAILTNHVGTVVNNGPRLYPYGEAQSGAASGEKFASYYRDSTTALDYTRNRYYSSTLGRFLTVDPYLPSAQAPDPKTWNRYAYVANNPVNLNDPSGLKIEITFHDVNIGGIASGYCHAAIRITPEHQSRWIDDSKWGSEFKNEDAQGRRYLTISAGPKGRKLTGELNRGSDVGPVSASFTLPEIGDLSEDDVISRLLTVYQNYRNELPYDPFPGTPYTPWGYNSDSYAAGLVIAVYGANCVPSHDIVAGICGEPLPGWKKPVPIEYFGSQPLSGTAVYVRPVDQWHAPATQASNPFEWLNLYLGGYSTGHPQPSVEVVTTTYYFP